MVGDSVAGADHRVVVQLIGKTKTRREQLFAVANTVVLRNAALAADQCLVGGRIVRFDAQPTRAPPIRIELPPQPEVDGQLRGGAPSIANVERVLVLEAVHLDELAALPGRRSRAQQKARQSVPVVLE